MASVSRKLFIGVDPGFKGALALLGADGSLIDVKDMPLLTLAGKTTLSFDAEGMPVERTGESHEIDTLGVVALLSDWRELANGEIIYCQERAWPRPQDGAVSAGKLLFGAGLLLGVAAGLRLPTTTVAPQTWKAKMGVSSEKSTSLDLAKAQFPKMANSFKLKKHDGRAEASLIALWQFQQNTQ